MHKTQKEKSITLSLSFTLFVGKLSQILYFTFLFVKIWFLYSVRYLTVWFGYIRSFINSISDLHLNQAKKQGAIFSPIFPTSIRLLYKFLQLLSMFSSFLFLVSHFLFLITTDFSSFPFPICPNFFVAASFFDFSNF